MVWTVESAVTAVMLMDVTTLLVTAAVWTDGLVGHYTNVHVLLVCLCMRTDTCHDNYLIGCHTPHEHEPENSHCVDMHVF